MAEPLRLMCVYAHPDDETFGSGPMLARYAAEGVHTAVVCATRGERGWQGDPARNPGLAELGRIREGELRAAAEVLGVREVQFLDYIDGDLDAAEPRAATAAVAAQLRRLRPQVVVTFGPDGAYGHPDHIAICQLTLAAVGRAADAAYRDAPGEPHQVSKLYFAMETADTVAPWREAFGDVVMVVDGVGRGPVVWPDWAVSARVDALAHRDQVRRAFGCHATQLPPGALVDAAFSDEMWPRWGVQPFFRALSLVGGGRAIEADLFEGLR